MMQHFGLEDLSHVQSRRNLSKYLVRVEMASDWFTRIYRSIFPPKSRYGVQTRLRALLEPAIIDLLISNSNLTNELVCYVHFQLL